MIKANFPIGIFDSGVGGLTVAHAIAKHLPNEQIIYFGDTQHMPYGDKSVEAIQHFSLNITDFLLERKCKVIVIACNTISAVAFDLLKKHINERAILINVIDPVVQAITQQKMTEIGIIATKRTIKSKVYCNKLKKANPAVFVADKATASLASIIEEGLFHNPKVIEAIVNHYLSDPQFNKIEALILGCTHYPIIKAHIQRYFSEQNKQVHIFDSTDTVANQVKECLHNHQIHTNLVQPTHQFFISDYTQAFDQTATLFFQQTISLKHYPIWQV